MKWYLILRINSVMDNKPMLNVYDYSKSAERIVVKGNEGLEDLRKMCMLKYGTFICFRYMEIKP